MSYTLQFSDPVLNPTPVTVVDNTINTATSVTFVGRGKVSYGTEMQQNTLRMLENFASSVAPSTPVIGQIWFDVSTPSTPMLRAWSGSRWQGSAIFAGNTPVAPASAVAAELWFNTSSGKLNYYNGSAWVELIGGGGPNINVGPISPTIPIDGMLWLDTVTRKLNYRTGTDWRSLSWMTFDTTAPASGMVPGDQWYDTIGNKLNYYDGTTWKPLGSVIVDVTPPASPSIGTLWYNSSDNTLYFWDSVIWRPTNAASGSGGNSVFRENDSTVTSSYTISTNKNAMSAGPIAVNGGVVVTVNPGSTWVVV